jgi:hypothetical protein
MVLPAKILGFWLGRVSYQGFAAAFAACLSTR